VEKCSHCIFILREGWEFDATIDKLLVVSLRDHNTRSEPIYSAGLVSSALQYNE